jgi:predicted alpha-1,2-mannosidase
MRFVSFLFLFSLVPRANAQSDAIASKPIALSSYVNPFIGTGGHGHTFPGATVPFGMVQLSPDTRIDGSWDGCSGYHYSDSFIYGFSHTHLSGTGVSDYGDILLLPSANPISFDPEEYKTKFSHKEEIAEANYYQVNLPNNGVKVRLTTDTWTGIHQYIFDKNEGYVLLDLKHRDKTLDFDITQVGKYTLEGFRISEGWAKEQHCYFSMDFNAPYTSISYNADSSKAVLYFDKLKNNTLECYVGISFTSVAGARNNLFHDIRMAYEWPNFESKMQEGKAKWNSELAKIEVFTADEDKKHIFYTALYHCMIHPNIAEDADGKYRGHDGKIHDSPNHTQYTVFSLWDTYRALHPLMTIIDEQRTTDFINSFLEIYKQSGRLPVWELASNETDCMIGYHSVSVIADAYMKGIRGFDTTLALEAMVASANEDIFGLDSYKKYGFVRAEDESESVSKTLEYSYDDWCIAQMARKMGEDSIADVFYRRAEAWRNIINPETGFATPRLNGDWLPNFDPKEVNLHFTEANSWQYSFVQHEAGILGSSEDLEKRLDALFAAKEQTSGRTQSDITGLVGQYAHGNEPSHHIAYLYDYTAHPEKGQKIIKQICDSFYTNTPDGLIGNEDCGQMSAWYVFSACGFYPVAPASKNYLCGQGSFKRVVIHNGENDILITETEDNYGTPIVNGTKSNYFKHSAFAYNSKLTFSRTARFISSIPIDMSFSEVKIVQDFVETPLMLGKDIFQDSTIIEIKPLNPDNFITYWLNDDDKSHHYSGPFTIRGTTKVRAYASKRVITVHRNGAMMDSFHASPAISATFYKKPNNWTSTPSIPPNSQYTGGGADALIDGIKGTENWQAGRWQGYQNEEVTFDLDFKVTKKVSQVSASFVQDARSWILMPSKVEVYHDGELVGRIVYLPNAFTEGNFLETFIIQLDKRVKTDKLQIKIYSAGKLPKGHPGHTMDGDAFFFVDEISVD